MTLKAETVPMPEKKISFKKGKNDAVYVYYTIRAYRNSRGKPTSDEVSIGKKDSATGRLIPNSRYFEFFPDSRPESTPKPGQISSFGNVLKDRDSDMSVQESQRLDQNLASRSKRRKATMEIISRLVMIRDAESGYLSRIPENLHGSERYEAADACVQAIDDAIELLTDAF
ncbi:MAG: hypothetical protein LBS10_06845 [Gracilibacteraceae bacterium]|jgi:hypothetical protein|nr:hypothetical protein [Gracilibacteraceae bacterium]